MALLAPCCASDARGRMVAARVGNNGDGSVRPDRRQAGAGVCAVPPNAFASPV